MEKGKGFSAIHYIAGGWEEEVGRVCGTQIKKSGPYL